MKQLVIERDKTSVPTYMTELSDDAWSTRLIGGEEIILTIPTGAVWAIISAEDYYWMKADGAITMPTPGAPFAKDDIELARDAITVAGITALHFKSRNDLDISVSFYG